jgi:PAS domain S-box-containing protein
MADLPFSHFDQAQGLLADLYDHLSSLPLECQSAVTSELDRFSEHLKGYLETKQDTLHQDSPGEQKNGFVHRHIPLKEHEPRMGMVLRKAHAGVFVQDLVNQTITWSPELYELLEIDTTEPNLSERFMRMIHSEDYPRVAQDIQKAIEEGGTFSLEFRVKRPDGAELWLSSIGYVEHDSLGRPLTLTGINQDITERKVAEFALVKAHAEVINERNRLMAVMEALPTGVAIYDLEGRIIQANRGFEDLWGSPRPAAYAVNQQIDYKAWWVMSGLPIQDEEWASTQAVKYGKTIVNQFLEIERFDGLRRYILNSGAPILDANGQVVGCAVAMHDISDEVKVKKALRKSEQSRRESEERFRLVLSSLPITVFMLDSDLRYTWVHNAQNGIAPEQMLGKRDDEIHPQVSDEHMAELRSVLETGVGLQQETSTGLFGEEKHLLLSYEAFYDLDGTIIGIIGAALDVTEQHRLEEEHREAIHQVEMQQKIVENRERERQEIAREIHDSPIQTLVSIMFDLHLAKEATDDPEVVEELDHVGLRLKGAIRELRDIVNNLRPPALLRFGLGKSLKVFAEDFKAKHPDLQVDLLFDLPDDSIYFSEETTLSLYRLCQEGLNNVARHAQAKKASIRFAQEGQNVILEIRDDGKGFFVPKDLIRKTKEGHFGLAGMKERVQAMGGEFRIFSHLGKGTSIVVLVPLEQTNPA